LYPYTTLLLLSLLAGTGDEELSGYLSALQAEADALQLSGKGAAADAALTPLAAAADELLESGDVPEAAVLESLGVATGPAERDVLEGLPNEEALQARQVVAALKLNKQELAEHILPEVRHLRAERLLCGQPGGCC
jgi:hypothetical protein